MRRSSDDGSGTGAGRAETGDPTAVERARVDDEETSALVEPPTAVDRPEPATVADEVSQTERPSTTGPSSQPTAPPSAATLITTAVEAMRDEEVHRTRVFIRLGWGASLSGIGAIPFVDSPRPMVIAYVAALVLGMVVSFGYHQQFRDPRKYGTRSLFVLGVMSTINTHVAILFFGAFTIAPVLIVIGLHFIGRSELAARRAVLITGCICHGVISTALITGVISDPGVFATARDLGTEAYVIGAIYVQAAYALAYYTGRSQRRVSLRSIEQLQRATRVASQRAALLDELRVDLERAQHAGVGRYSDRELGGFRLGAVLGRGAHGEVYEATDTRTHAPAAIKLLHLEQLSDPTVVTRFLREAKATAAISSPHIVRVLGASEPHASPPFLAMERLRGLTLAELLRRTNPLPAKDVVTMVAQIGAGLDATRPAGVVHRDLKPQNLMLDDGTWKILDFGVAALAEQGGTLTRGGIVGTPQYMAPEQARAERVDHRTDLYALGVVAFRALTGRNPFGGGDTPQILYAVVHQMPPRPTSLGDLHPDVDRWAAHALAKDPEARPPSGAALASLLARALRGELTDSERMAADRLIEHHPWRDAA